VAGKRILVVDDDPDIRLMFRLILESAGYQVGEARNGVAALILIKDSPPDLVITDMVMDGMGGRELIERIRSDERTAKVPILAVTGHPAAREQAARADAVFDKPIDRPGLLAKVSSLIDQ